MAAVPLADCAGLDVSRVGAKARNLAVAADKGFPVPNGVALPPDEEPDPRAIAAELGAGPYAVRSSAPDEDGGERSSAGQFKTLVGVARDELREAVLEVRWSRPGQRGAAGDGAIPVLVQPLVRATAAGVAFSIDPRDGSDSVSVIEAVRGLGDTVTDGSVTPARFRVDALTGAIATDRPDAEWPLRPAQLRAVDALVRGVAASRGAPCDVEWAWADSGAWLVQVRPITGLRLAPAPGQWTTANFAETMPGIVTPLTASIALAREFPEALADQMRELRLARARESVTEGRRFYGRAYWRVDTVKERLLGLPGFRERSFDETVGIQPSYAGDGRTAPLTPRSLWRGVRLMRTLHRSRRSHGRAVPAYRELFAHRERASLSADIGTLDARALGRAVVHALGSHCETTDAALRVSFLSEYAQDMLRELLRLVARRVDEPPRESVLLASLGGLPTAAAAQEAARLGRRHAGSVERITAAHEPADLPRDVRVDFESWVARFGYMAEADDELANPRWDEDVAVPLAVLKSAVRAAPVERGGTASADRLEEERRLLGAAGPLRPALRWALSLAREYARLREETRELYARENRLLRRALLAQADSWVARGTLPDRDAVFWLTVDEVLAAIDDRTAQPPLARLAAARRRHAEQFREWEPPPVLGGDTPPPAVAPAAGSTTLTGVPCSAGRAEGPVHVLRDLRDVGSVESGAVLVLKYSNPGWTPAYVAAAALVTEEGGLLSHGSIIAREHGLPAVINVRGATDLLRTGARVTVDGTAGTVTVIDGG